MGDDFNESADGGGTYTNDTNSTLQVALQPATPHLSLRRIAQAQLGRCMLLELPAELRNMIWKAVFSFSAVPHLRELHKFKKSDYDLVLRPLLEILLTCKQIYEEAKDMIWMLNTFRITTGPRERGDIYTAQSHPLWSKFRNIHFEGILELPWVAFPSACKVADTLTIAFLAARILSEPHLRIRSLIIHFQMYDVLHTLERHINLFAQIKVQEEVYFRISLKPDYFSISGIPPLAFSSRVNFAATEAFDMMIGEWTSCSCGGTFFLRLLQVRMMSSIASLAPAPIKLSGTMCIDATLPSPRSIEILQASGSCTN